MLLDVLGMPTGSAKDFMLVAGLLALVDRPLKNSIEWEDAGIDDISNMEISENEKIIEAQVDSEDEYDYLYHSVVKTAVGYRELNDFRCIKKSLEKSIKKLPFRNITDSKDGHKQAFSEVLHKIIDEFQFERSIQNSRIMTLWLLMLALEIDEATISSNKLAFIDTFRNHFDIEDDVFEDLQERATTLFKELEKTKAIIIE